MEPTSNSTFSPRTRAFVLLRKLDKNGSLTEAETHELVEIQTDLPTTSVKTEINSFKSIVEARFESVDSRFDSVDTKISSIKESQDIRFDILDKRFAHMVKWLRIASTTGIGIILTMGGWLISSLLTGGS